MTHDDALQMLSARVDGELTPEQDRELDAWLNEHPDGRVIAEAFTAQDAEMRRAFEERQAAAIRTAERVIAQLPMPVAPTAPSKPRSGSWRLWAVLPPVSAVAVLAVVAFYWVRQQGPAPAPTKDIAQRSDTVALNPADLLTPRARPVAPPPVVAAVGEKLSTRAGEKKRAVLADGSILYMNQNTSVELAADRLVKLTGGQIFVEASPVDEAAGRGVFQVETASHKLTARGTKFAVDAANEELSLLVTQGKVQIDGEKEPVVAGQVVKANVEKVDEPAPARQASYELGWTRDLMIAADSPLVPAGRYDGGALVAVDPYGQEAKLSLVKYHIDVHIEDGFARTTIDQTYFNSENFQMEGTFYFPLPPDASLSRLAMYVANGEMCSLMEGGMAERDFARQTYERIRHARRDPALLEWVDGSLFKMRVFPLEARQEKRLVLSYTQKLPVQYGRTSYRFPAGHTLNVVKQWSFEALVKGGAGLTATSPSHPAMKIERAANDLVLRDKAELAKIDRDVVLEFNEPPHPSPLPRSGGEGERDAPMVIASRPTGPLARSGVEGEKDAPIAKEPRRPGPLPRSGGDGEKSVLELKESPQPDLLPLSGKEGESSVRWSSAEHDGAKYLMLRYRPELQGSPRRERRDWVFLFEASGARDPLVARAQVEVIRALLNNAEHDDTFALLTVGTRVHKFNEEALRVTPENVADALAFLDKTHLIGALNLEQGLSEAAPYLAAGANPHLVHLGGGVATLGEQRADKLIPRIPQGTRYVGVAVGKRFSPAFMKVAAEKTGGFFTQINPDEPIAWRGFELSSALNTPRLLDISLTVSATPPAAARFLPFTNALSQGEELAAVARIDGAAPAAITVHGVLDGVPFERTIAVRDVRPNADYLPRTWAKLEIDRLLAEDAGKHRQTITELSRSMYVMTPFTSLLVLENEAMYKEFKVDRGRKDHWAMYPCPEKIPTVYIPDPNQPADRNAPEFVSRKPHENVVMQTIVRRSRQEYLTLPDGNHLPRPLPTGGVAGIMFDTEYSILLESPNSQTLYGHLDSEKDLAARIDTLTKKVRVGDVKIFGNAVTRENVIRRQLGIHPGQILSSSDSIFVDASSPDLFGVNAFFSSGAEMKRPISAVEGRRGWVSAGEMTEYRAIDKPDLTNPDVGLDADLAAAVAVDRESDFNVDAPAVDAEAAGLPNSEKDFASQTSQLGLARLSSANDLYEPSDLINVNTLGDLRNNQFNSWSAGISIEIPLGGRSGAARERQLRIARDQIDRMRIEKLYGYEGRPVAGKFFNASGSTFINAILNDAPQAPRYYGRPSFNDQYRVFTDLASYAPGMSSSDADIRAVLEAEAAPRSGLRRGSIDPAARKRIDSARQATWRALAFKDATGADCLFNHDGQGRYAYERRIAFGLIERVVCDGSTILHLYPELGIGARRQVSRFHRAELCDMLCDVLPPADDLNFGFDVKLLDENTVALVPLQPENATPRAAIETHLVFEGNRLAQRRWVLMPAKKELCREVYANDGPILLVDAKGKETGKDVRTITRAAAPDLKPDVSSLVVLSLPLRSRDLVYRKYGLDPQRNVLNENFVFTEGLRWLPPEAPLELLSCEFAANNGDVVREIWRHCFAKRGDMRPGFFTLMLSCGQSLHELKAFGDLCATMVNDGAMTPLMRYLSLAFEPHAEFWQRQLGILPGPKPADDFLGNLLAFRALSLRWQGNAINDHFLGNRAVERERAIAFARQHAGNVWGWCSLGMVADRASGAEFHQQIAAAWGLLAEKSGLRYHARYEQAVNLMQAGQCVEARDLFRRQFQETFKKGILPPLDRRFRDALVGGTDGNDWRSLMLQAARECIAAKHRPTVVQLAWQCRQLGDQALADELLGLALHNPTNEVERVVTTLAAIEYLWAIEDFDQADMLAHQLLAVKQLQQVPSIWRLAAKIAERRGERIRQFECLEKALDLEFSRMPAVFSIEPVRRDYGALLNHFEWLAEASRNLHVSPPADLLARTVRAADRWRSLDAEATGACDQAAKILRLIGGTEAEALAWDFLTTPLALRPNESAPWLTLAQSSTREGNLALADQCYEAAFAAEPTNAQILWDRAMLLERHGQTARSRDLLKQLGAGDWQPRFEGLKLQARQVVEGK